MGDLEFFNLPEEMDLETGGKVIIIKRPLKFSKTVFNGRISTWNRSIRRESQTRVKFLSI